MQFNNYFIALINEAQFTKDILGIGVTQIRKANYACQGVYYESFTCLSTGLERIGKLVILLDYYIDNKGKFPNSTYLKKVIGHDIQKLYNDCRFIPEKQDLSLKFSLPDKEIHQNIIALLSEFAKGDRYSNIDLLTGFDKKSDPIQRWSEKVDDRIYADYITNKKKEKILINAETISKKMCDFTMVRHISETRESIDSVFQGSLLTGIQNAVAPLRQLFLLQIIRGMAELLVQLGYKAQTMNNEDIPYFSEIFGGYYNDDQYFKTKRRWDNI